MQETNTLAYLAKVVFCIQLRTGVRQKILNLINQPDNVFIKFGSKIVIRVKTNDRDSLSTKSLLEEICSHSYPCDALKMIVRLF